MSTTENLTFTTAQSGIEVVYKPFITGYEKRHIDDAYLEDITIDAEGDKKFNIPAVKTRIRMDRAIVAVIVSVAGKTEDVVKEVLSLDARDSAEIEAKIQTIIGDRKKAAAGSAPSAL